MGVFGDLRSLSRHDAETILEAAKAIEKASSRLTRPWSIAEIQCDDEDYQWLKEVAASLEYRPVAEMIRGSRGQQAAIGLLLLAIAAEVGRREGKEGAVWGDVSKCFRDAPAYSLLFYAGQPSPLHKEVLEVGAREHGLRHVFGIEGLQNWFDTVALQYGITRWGIVNRLPYWLAGQPRTQAIERLSEDESQHSQSFMLLWDILLNWRKNNVPADRARESLTRSPWVLRDDVDLALAAARKHLDLGATDGGPAPEPPLLSQPALLWVPGTPPTFRFSLQNLAALDDLSAARYEVVLGNQTVATIFRNEDGWYDCPSPDISLPVLDAAPEMDCFLREAEQVLHHQTVLCWDPRSEVNVFRLDSGRRLTDPWNGPLPAGHDIALFVPSDLTVHPASQTSRGPEGYSVRRVLGDATAELTVEDGKGNSIWKPSSPDSPSRRVSVEISPVCNHGRLGRIGLNLTYPSDWELRYVRCCIPLGFSVTAPGNARTDDFTIPLGCLRRSRDPQTGGTADVDVLVGLSGREGPVSVRTNVTLPLEGAMFLHDNGQWVEVPQRSEFDVGEHAGRAFHVFVPRVICRERIDRHHWAVLLGSTFLCRLRGLVQVPRVVGHGESLDIVVGPYNAQHRRCVIPALVNTGLLRGAEREGHHLTMLLRRSVEPGTDHRAIVWSDGGKLSIFRVWRLESSPDAPERWRCELPDGIGEVHAVALAYGGSWLGTANMDFAAGIEGVDMAYIQDIACFIRWAHMPVLASQHVSDIKELVAKYGGAILPSWTAETWNKCLNEVVRSLKPSPDDGSSWNHCVRTLFADWTPKDREEVWKVLSDLATEDSQGAVQWKPEEQYAQAMLTIARVDPVLLGRLLAKLVGHKGTNDPVSLRSVIRTVRYSGFAEGFRPTGELEWAAQRLGVDSSFLENAVLRTTSSTVRLQTVDDRNTQNLQIALNDRALWQLVLHRVLNTLELWEEGNEDEP